MTMITFYVDDDNNIVQFHTASQEIIIISISPHERVNTCGLAKRKRSRRYDEVTRHGAVRRMAPANVDDVIICRRIRRFVAAAAATTTHLVCK